MYVENRYHRTTRTVSFITKKDANQQTKAHSQPKDHIEEALKDKADNSSKERSIGASFLAGGGASADIGGMLVDFTY
jgi:hypothetical protein